MKNCKKEIRIFIPDDHILSTQHIYGQFRGRRYMKKEGKEKKVYYASFFSNIKKPFTCKLSMDVKLFFPDNRRRDVDNYNKVLLDAFTGVIYEDDSQLYHLGVDKVLGCKEKSGIEIVIKPYK